MGDVLMEMHVPHRGDFRSPLPESPQPSFRGSSYPVLVGREILELLDDEGRARAAAAPSRTERCRSAQALGFKNKSCSL